MYIKLIECDENVLNTRADADNLKMGKYWFIGKTDH